MVIRYFVLSGILLHGLVAVASENSQAAANRSNGDLRRSQGGLSQSQELRRSSRQNGVTGILYSSPCSNRLYSPRQDMIPLDSTWKTDCP